jgi:Secretion system C-terminal sorting domain
MKKLLLSAVLMLSFLLGYGQKQLETHSIPGIVIECPIPDFSKPYVRTYVPPPAEYLRKFDKNARPQADRSKFIVNYVDFPTDAKAAFQRAVDIWQSIMVSDVPIRITANWESLGRNVLGSASTSSLYRDFPGANKAYTYYPIALAEKMNHVNLNGDNSDIIARFNADFNWYLGVDGNPPANRQDFVSTVLHEIGHGLGFFGSLRPLDNDDTQGIITNGSVPYIYDHYVENLEKQKLLNTDIFKNPSVELLKALTGGNLYANSPEILKSNDTLRARLYAPGSYQAGSSYSHLDESTYKTGTINATMTPQGANGEVNANPGPIVLAFFREMGWVGSSIIHKRFTDSEDLNKPLVFEVKVFSDTTYKPETVKLIYSLGDVIKTPTEVKLTPKGDAGNFTFTLPADGKEKVITYYFTAEDNAGRKIITPAQAPNPVISKIGSSTVTFATPYKFRIGADTTKPDVTFVNNLSSIFATDTKVTIPELTAIDNIGIDTVYVEYQVDGKVLTPFALKRGTALELISGGTGNVFTGTFDFTSLALKGGEKISYRVIVQDKSSLKNKVIFPKTGFYDIQVQKIAAAVNKYATDFESTPSTDFFLKGFSAKSLSGSSKSMQSDHPYADGSENNYPGSTTDKFTNYIFNLLKPIVVRSDTANIYFDEIALVEPGDDGIAFQTNGAVNRNFYDYVIVEGSKDAGKTWKAFQDGWDANAQTVWRKAWDSNIDADGNSLAVADASLFKPRVIDMLKSGAFKGGDEILIRFRMLADVGGYGWGWAVDNLNIQGNNPNPVKVVKPLASEPIAEQTELKLTPNPSNDGQFLMTAKFVKPAGNLTLSVVTLSGKEVSSMEYQGVGKELNQVIDLSRLIGGVYLVRMQAGDEVIIRKAIYSK